MAKKDPDMNMKKMSAPADFDGPTMNRRCTDVLFALILLVCWGIMTGIGIYAFRGGDYRAVLYPMDYSGNVCGTDFGAMDMTEYPKIVYVNSKGGGVCVKECPTITEEQGLVDVHTLITYGGVYQEDGSFLPADYVQMPDYSSAEGVKTCDSTSCNTAVTGSYYTAGIFQGLSYAWYAMDTFQVLGTRCIANPAASDALKENIFIGNATLLDMEGLNEARSVWNNLYGDLWASKEYILLFGCLGAMVVGFLYSQLLRIQVILGVMIWGSIAASIGILFACGGYAYYIAGEWAATEEQVHSDWNIRAAKICSYILFGLGGLAVVITIFLRKQIQLSMACVKAAARSMSAMPTMVLFPFMQVIGVAAFMIVLLVYGVHLASLGDITTEPTGVTGVAVRKYEFDELTKQMGWYLLFCAFWTVSFVIAMGEIAIAMCVSKWYFSRDKSKVGMCTVFSAIGETFRYHIGTAAFGSFIIAVTKMVRAFVTYLQKKAKDMNNKVGEALLCCCQCCLWLFEKVIKFLNKNAYIQTAIFGTAFCRSAREAFTLIMRNAGKVASITYVSTLILFVGKIFISALTTGAAYVYIDRELGEEIYSTAGPCFVIFVSSFFIGEMFLSIFDMSTSTILQCFVADEEMFDGDECYAEGDLRKWIDDFEEEERRIIAGQT